jgi:hypothetical protein
MQGSMHGIERMKQSRAVRHKAAWEKFATARDAARAKQEAGIASLINDFKVGGWLVGNLFRSMRYMTARGHVAVRKGLQHCQWPLLAAFLGLPMVDL